MLGADTMVSPGVRAATGEPSQRPAAGLARGSQIAGALALALIFFSSPSDNSGLSYDFACVLCGTA